MPYDALISLMSLSQSSMSLPLCPVSMSQSPMAWSQCPCPGLNLLRPCPGPSTYLFCSQFLAPCPLLLVLVSCVSDPELCFCPGPLCSDYSMSLYWFQCLCVPVPVPHVSVLMPCVLVLQVLIQAP